MRADCSFLRAANGLRFAYVEQGEREGLPVLMLHGYTDSHRSFDLIRPHLPEAWRVIALTQRGHGRSDKPSSGYDMATMAADVPAFLDALGIERAVIVGHSMGAAVTVQAAADYPDRVAGVALIGAFASFQNKAEIDELATEVARFGDAVDPEFVLAFQQSTVGELMPQTFLDVVVAESLRCPAHVWRAALAGQRDSESHVVARRCRAPFLLVRGENDQYATTADHLTLRERLRSARSFTVPGAGHAPHWERPEEVAYMLRAFVAELDDADILRHAVFG